MSDDEQGWIQEGAHVFIDSRHGISRGIIARLTKTQIVLGSGAKFNRRTLRAVGESDALSFVRLKSADDPTTRARELIQRRDKAARIVQTRAEEFRKNQGEANARAVEQAIERWRALSEGAAS